MEMIRIDKTNVNHIYIKKIIKDTLDEYFGEDDFSYLNYLNDITLSMNYKLEVAGDTSRTPALKEYKISILLNHEVFSDFNSLGMLGPTVYHELVHAQDNYEFFVKYPKKKLISKYGREPYDFWTEYRAFKKATEKYNGSPNALELFKSLLEDKEIIEEADLKKYIDKMWYYLSSIYGCCDGHKDKKKEKDINDFFGVTIFGGMYKNLWELIRNIDDCCGINSHKLLQENYKLLQKNYNQFHHLLTKH